MLLNQLKIKLQELFGIDVRALALMRMGLALLLLSELVMRGRYLSAHYTDDGVLSRLQAINLLSEHTISAYLMSSSHGFALFLFLVTALFACFLFVGYRTTLSTFVCWFLLQSLHARNLWVNNGGDIYFQNLFFFAIFLPWGAIWSVDSLYQKTSRPIPGRIMTMGTAAFLLQIAMFYTFAGLHKSDLDWSVQGTALYYAIHMEEYSRPIAQLLLQFPALLKFSTFAIYYFECVGASLLFIPFAAQYIRVGVLGVFYSLHVSILLTFVTGLFQFTSMVGLLAFWPSWVLDKMFGPLKPQGVGYDINKKPNLFKFDLIRMPMALSILVFCLIFYVFVLNMETLKNPVLKIPKELRWIQSVLYLDQPWYMFAPVNKETGWLVIPGKLKNAQVVDVFREGKMVDWQKPYAIVDLYKDSLWGKYYFNLHTSGKKNLLFYGQYLCRSWNKKATPDNQLLSFDIYYMRQVIPFNQPKPNPTRHLLWTHYCFENSKIIPAIKEEELPIFQNY